MTSSTNPYYQFFNVQSDDDLELCLIAVYNELQQVLYDNPYKHLRIA